MKAYTFTTQEYILLFRKVYTSLPGINLFIGKLKKTGLRIRTASGPAQVMKNSLHLLWRKDPALFIPSIVNERLMQDLVFQHPEF